MKPRPNLAFMLISCNIDHRRDLQKCENDALRICGKVSLQEHVRISDLHSKFKIVSLEQQRRIQLLLLIYKKSTDISMHKVLPRGTRNSRRIVFRTDNYEGRLYKRSPYFVGSNLWDALPQDTINLADIFSFKTRIKRL